MSPAHPDGPGDAKLVLALRGEHNEDKEDQEHPGRHRELPEEQEDGRERLPTLVGLIDGVFLDGLGRKVVLPQDRTQGLDGVFGARAAFDGGAFVGDEDGVDPTLLPTRSCNRSSGMTIDVDAEGLAPRS